MIRWMRGIGLFSILTGSLAVVVMAMGILILINIFAIALGCDQTRDGEFLFRKRLETDVKVWGERNHGTAA